MNEAASALGKQSAAKRRKRLGKKGMSDVMRALANKRHGNLTKKLSPRVTRLCERSHGKDIWVKQLAMP